MDRRTQRYLDRLEELIEEGRALAASKTRTDWGPEIPDTQRKNSWLVRCQNIVEAAFGTGGPHYKRLQEITDGGVSPYGVDELVGLLEGAYDDLEGGFLVNQKLLIAGEVLDSVLAEATALQNAGYHDCAAVLGRVALEDALRRLASEEGVDASQKASGINDDLKEAGFLPQPKWRQIQVWLDVGNAAAHGKTDEYDPSDVKSMLDGVRQFLAMDFHA